VLGVFGGVGDTEAMAKKAIYLLESEDRLNEFKDQAYQYSQKFSIDNILPKYEQVYREVKSDCC